MKTRSRDHGRDTRRGVEEHGDVEALAVFNNSWYPNIVQRFCCDTERAESVNPAIDGLGRCILVAACIIAQHLSELTEAIEEIAKNGSNHRRRTKRRLE